MTLPTLRHSMKWFRYGEHLDPARDWFVLLVVGGMLFVIIVVWNIWAFDRVAHGGVLGEAAQEEPLIFSRESLDAIQSIFEERATEAARYETGTYTFTDPSQ